MSAADRPDLFVADDEADVVISGEAVALDLRPTGFVLRGAGLAIDWLVYFVGGSLLLAFVVLPLLSPIVGDDADAQTAITLAMTMVMLIVVPITVELLSHGKSLGKLAVGARIVRDDGGAIGFRHAFIRALVGVLEIYATLGGGAVVVSLLNSRSKRLGDLLAGTYSQYERTSKEVVPTFGVPTELVTWSLTADVGRMPDRLAGRIAQFLRQAGHLTPATRDRLSRELAAEASPWVHPVPQANAELFLAAVTVIRRDREYRALMLQRARLADLKPALEGMPHDFPDRS